MEGIEKLKAEVDSLIVIPNERLKTLGSKTTTFKDLIMRADEVLLQAVKGISDLIISNGFISLDFADVKKVMEQMGNGHHGHGKGQWREQGLGGGPDGHQQPAFGRYFHKRRQGLSL